MSRLRSSMVLLGISVVALLIGALRLATEKTPLPVGSSYSAQPDGALALYEWADAVGVGPVRLKEASVAEAGPATLLVLQPETPVDPLARAAFDAVPRRGGTLILAGDDLSWLLYARGLGIEVDSVTDHGSRSVATPDGSLSLDLGYRYRLNAAGATPLLVASNGDWVALRMPYKDGSLVVLAAPEPLTNAGLGNQDTARFVYREIVPSKPGAGLGFDEGHHSFAPPSLGPPTLNQLLFSTSIGGAIVYVALLAFVYIVLSGRRLGPPIPARPPAATRRTMYEHVQMLADLYRRAGQFPVVRAAFGRQVSRELARGVVGSPRRAAGLAQALVLIEGARTESELIAAVAAADDA
jgi:hypothetical protein